MFQKLILWVLSLIMSINSTISNVLGYLTNWDGTHRPPTEDVSTHTTLEESGEESAAIFDRNGKQVFMTPGVWYDYKTATKKGTVTVGKAMAYNYEIINGNDYLPAKAGYVWKLADFILYFDDAAAYDGGFTISYSDTNGYDSAGFSKGTKKLDDGNFTFHINWHDKDVECLGKSDYYVRPWVYPMEGHYSYCIRRLAVQVPADFDGMVEVFRDAAITYGEGDSISNRFADGEGYLVFRFGNVVDESLQELTTFPGTMLPYDPYMTYIGCDIVAKTAEEEAEILSGTGYVRGTILDSLEHRYIWFGDSFGWVKVMF